MPSHEPSHWSSENIVQRLFYMTLVCTTVRLATTKTITTHTYIDKSPTIRYAMGRARILIELCLLLTFRHLLKTESRFRCTH